MSEPASAATNFERLQVHLKDCQTALQIDGKPATESALDALGIRDSKPTN